MVNYILKHRFVIYLLALSLCVAGLFCLFVIPVAPYPQPKFNNFYVHISYAGANADTVEQQITSKAVSALQAMPYVRDIDANSRNGVSNIDFSIDSKQPNIVMQTQMQVSQAIAAAGLPDSASTPYIQQSAGSSDLQDFVVTSDHLSLFKMGNYLAANLYPALNAISGVTLDDDDQDPVIHVQWLPNKLVQYHLQPAKISQLLNLAFQSSPLGKLYISQQPYSLLLKNPLRTLTDFANLIVGYQTSAAGSVGNPIRLSDVANITFGRREPIMQESSSYNDHPALGISLRATGDANPFTVAKFSTAAINRISATLPADMHITKTFDAVKNMRQSFNEVLLTIAISSLLVLLIAWMFLGRLRLTLIPIATIPICLLGSVIFISALGFSLNIITLLAMVIAVGLVVDDSIVVVENIISYMEKGMGKAEAIVQGTSSIALTIIGITATLLAVYLPISFIHGNVFMFFLTAFAVPLAAAVFISGIVALTLTPVMCVTFISDAKANRYQKVFNAGLERVIKFYQFFLRKILNRPLISLIAVICLIAAGVYMLRDMPRQLFPADPEPSVSIYIRATAADTMQNLESKMTRFDKFYKNKKVKWYAKRIFTNPENGGKLARIWIQYDDNYLHQIANFSDTINKFIKRQKIVNTTAQMNMIDSSGGQDAMPATLYAAETIAKLNKQVVQLKAVLDKSPIFNQVYVGIATAEKQLSFTTDNAQAARFGIYHSQLAATLADFYGGYSLRNNFEIDGLSVPVMLGLDDASLKDPQSIQQLQIKSSNGNYYPLSQFVHLKMVAHPTEIDTFNGKSSVEVYMSLAKGHSLAEAIPYFNSTVARVAPGLSIQYQGTAKKYIDGSTQSMWVMILGISCVYLLLALLFHSLIDPFIILLTVPFSVVGGALVLHLFGGSLNIFSTLSLITLVGLITKHGVLIVRFANAQLQRGINVKDAVIHATHDRFRPIIMTTLAMTLGVLPLALSYETMYVSRRDLAIVLMGGLMIGTFFSLFVVPLVYSLLKKNHNQSANEFDNQNDMDNELENKNAMDNKSDKKTAKSSNEKSANKNHLDKKSANKSAKRLNNSLDKGLDK